MLEKRELGLISRPDLPIRTITEIAAGDHRFVNRQNGSGTRLTFDGLLSGAELSATATLPVMTTKSIRTPRWRRWLRAAKRMLHLARGAPPTKCIWHSVPWFDERFYIVCRRDGDSELRNAVEQFCRQLYHPHEEKMKADEFNPTVAVLKRVHNAGFWETRKKTRS